MAHFLDTPEAAFEWAKKNAPDFYYTYEEAVEEFGEDSDAAEEAKDDEERFREAGAAYSEYYHEAQKTGAVEVHRIVRVPSIEDIDWEDLGVYWSFESWGAGAYDPRNGGQNVRIVGKVSPDAIDWKRSFVAYLSPHGRGEVEAHLKPLAPVSIVSVDGEPPPRQEAKARLLKLKASLLR